MTVMKMQRPGKITIHQASKFERPAFNSDPQVVIFEGTPTPMNDKADSMSMAFAIPNDIEMSAGAIALGSACLAMIRRSLKSDVTH